jgi:hypothetical protein
VNWSSRPAPFNSACSGTRSVQLLLCAAPGTMGTHLLLEGTLNFIKTAALTGNIFAVQTPC